MTRSIDLNADLGEGFPHDVELLDRVTSASISCGAHAGDRESIRNALRAAKERDVRIGAHPGFADRDNFGRREQSVSAAEVFQLILKQVKDFNGLAGEFDTPPLVLKPHGAFYSYDTPLLYTPACYIKPHGALYNQAQRDPEIARGVVTAAALLGLPVLGQPRSALCDKAKNRSVRFIAEGFPDRRYRPDGRLVARDEPDAIIHDPGEMEERVEWLLDEGVGTLCIHGDDPNAVANADRVRAVLDRLGIAVRSFL